MVLKRLSTFNLDNTSDCAHYDWRWRHGCFKCMKISYLSGKTCVFNIFIFTLNAQNNCDWLCLYFYFVFFKFLCM